MSVLSPRAGTVAPPASESSRRLLKELPSDKLAWMLQRMCEVPLL